LAQSRTKLLPDGRLTLGIIAPSALLARADDDIG
jgi:hypothetical protein